MKPRPRWVLRAGVLALGTPLLLATSAVPQSRPRPPGGDCQAPGPPVLSGVTAMAGPGRVTLSWSAAPPGSVAATRAGSDRSSATFRESAGTTLVDTSVNPFVSSYTYTLQPFNCAGQGRPATASVTMPPFHLLVGYGGGSLKSPTLSCNGDCPLASLNVVASCGVQGASPFLPGCDFSGVLFHRGAAIDAAHPLPVGGFACSSTTVLPPSPSATVEAISGVLTKDGATVPWNGVLARKATFGEMAGPSAVPWGTADLTGGLRLVYQCPPGTLAP